MSQVMVQFRYIGKKPTLVEAAQHLGVTADRLEPDFGVIATDPESGLFTVLVDEAAAATADATLRAMGAGADEGAFSNPQIGPLDERQ
jgi:hypothetical protein